MKNLFLLLLSLAVSAATALAYPISPRPLRKLVQESEYIIIAHVADLREQKNKKDDPWSGFVAELLVREVLQGRIMDTIVYVSYSPYMICPAPPHFEKNTEVMVFLDKRDKRFYVHALSYGVKTLNQEEMELYKRRVKEMQEILLIPDQDEQFIKTTDWLVKCAEHQATRYEGIYELMPGSNFMSFYDRSESQPFQFALNADQKARLQKVLLATPSLTYSELGLIDLVYADKPEEVYAFMLNGFRALTQDNYWMAGEFMKRLMYYKSTDQLQKLANDFESKAFGINREDSSMLKKIMDEFLAEIEKE